MNRDAKGSSQSLPRGLLPLVALGALVATGLLFVPNFGQIELRDGRLFGAFIDILHRATPVILLAIGMTLVIATRGIDLSVGAVMAIAGAVAALMLAGGVAPLWAVIAAGLGAAVAAGIWNGALVAYLGIQPIVATLILMVAGRGLAQLLTDGQIITFENAAFEYLGNGSLFYLPFTVFVAVAVWLVAEWTARKTVLGPYIQAVGGNEIASRYSGINTAAVKLFVYVFSGLCAGMAGLLAASDIKAADPSHAGLYLELDAILAVVIGGTTFAGGKFNLAGSVVGAVIIQTLTTGILMRGIGVEYTMVVKAVTVIVVCYIQTSSVIHRPRTRRRAT